jgi:flavodoxin I
MKALVVYDSAYGNTARVARAIRERLDADLALASEATTHDLEGIELLIVGSPTQGGRPTEPVQTFLDELPDLHGLRVAAFDTRLDKQDRSQGIKFLMGIIGFAAEKEAKSLRRKGGHVVGNPAGFVVTGKEGPLAEHELERAGSWAGQLAAQPA